jgi:hypothetical protein
MVRTQPQAVRAVVLDSTVGPETLTYELQALGDYEAKLWPFADCEQTPTCRGRFGEMAGRFVALINRLDEEGAALTVGDNLLDAGALYNITHLALNRPDLIALLPLIVDELDRGATATYQALLNHEFDVAPQRQSMPLSSSSHASMPICVHCQHRALRICARVWLPCPLTAVSQTRLPSSSRAMSRSHSLHNCMPLSCG